MRIKFKGGKQKWLIDQAVLKAGSERKLKKILGIPNQTINFYRREFINLPENRLNLMLNFLNLDKEKIKDFIEVELDDNWGREKGGYNLIKKYKKSKYYEDYLIYLRKRGRKIFINLHKKWKKKDSEAYYKMQYERFKKVGKYKYKTNRGEIVRNKLEKDTADFLDSLELKYNYEPYVKVNNSVYFPDFMIGNLIIECTAWRGYLKIKNIKRKIKDFEKEGFNIIFVIPLEVKKFYKAFDDKIITNLYDASVAQTVRELSVGRNGRATAL